MSSSPTPSNEEHMALARKCGECCPLLAHNGYNSYEAPRVNVLRDRALRAEQFSIMRLWPVGEASAPPAP